jgi:hypothetical protein
MVRTGQGGEGADRQVAHAGLRFGRCVGVIG